MVKCYTSYYYSIEKAPRQTEKVSAGLRVRGGSVCHLYPHTQQGEEGEDGERLPHEVRRVPGADLLERDRVVPAHQDEGNAGSPAVPPHPLEEFNPRHLRHIIVRDDETKLLVSAKKLPCFSTVLDQHDSVAGLFHHVLDQQPNILAVVHH